MTSWIQIAFLALGVVLLIAPFYIVANENARACPGDRWPLFSMWWEDVCSFFRRNRKG